LTLSQEPAKNTQPGAIPIREACRQSRHQRERTELKKEGLEEIEIDVAAAHGK